MIWLKKTTELALSNNHSLTDWSAVDVVFECRSGQTKDYRFIFVASTLRIRKMCLSGATCNHGLLLQSGSYYNSNWSYCSSTKWTSSSHRKLTCFRHDTAEKIAHLALNNKHPLTILLSNFIRVSVRTPFMTRCTQYNIMWWSLSVICGR